MAEETLYTELFNLVFGEEEEGLTTTVSIDVVLRKLQTRSIALDAILSAVQTLTQTVDLDAILRALKTEDVSLDAVLRIVKTKDIDVDAILKKLQTADISVDSILRIAKTYDLDLDAVLRLAKTFTVNADAILRKTKTKTITLDTVFDVLGYTWGSSTITRDGHKKQIWDGWKLAGGGAARFDASYGKLQINSGETFYSPVKDFGTASSKLLEIDTDYYDTGSGTPGSIYWRGSTELFDWDAGSNGRIIRPVGWQKPIRGTQLNRAHPLARGLRRCYIFNELNGDIVNDLSGNSNGIFGTNFGGFLSWTGDNIENPSTNAFLTCNTVVASTWTQTFKIFVYASPTDPNARLSGIAEYDFEFTINADDEWGYYEGAWRDTNVAVPLNTWLNVSVAYTGTDILIYVNGILIYTGVGDGRAVNGDLFLLNEGATGAKDEGADNIYLNLFYFHNRALSATEISQLHAQPYGMFQTERRVSGGGGPDWEEYTSPTEKTWRYVQVYVTVA